MSESIDTSDVPFVALRELAVTHKMWVAEGKTLTNPDDQDEAALRDLEQIFWQRCNRGRSRKVAVLVRFRSLIEACRARSVRRLIETHGQPAVLAALVAAASMRLNTKWGFSPQKLSREIHQALAAAKDDVALAA